jgi:outer membrane autotransporter protein
MIGTASNPAGTHHRHRRTTPAVAPIARAIRTALAVSAFALSLTAPSFAGECRGGTVAHASACRVDAPYLLREDPAVVTGGALPVAVHAAPDVRAAIHVADIAPAPGVPSGVTDIVHDGVTDVFAPAGEAIGLGYADDDVTIRNTGHVGAHGLLSAIGIDASGTDVQVDNDGTIFAETVYAAGYAPAIGVRVFGDGVHVANHAGGVITAEASADDGRARARAIYAVGFAQGVSVDNDGALAAFAQADGGRAEAHGVYAFGYGGPTTVHNAGDIDSHAIAAGGRSYATGINAIGYGAGDNLSEVVNTGTIDALAEGARAYAFGTFNLTRQRDGSAHTDNAGSIHAQAAGDYATAMGVTTLALRYGDATTTSSGDITVVADGLSGGSATGLYNHAYVYDAVVDNAGMIDVSASGDAVIAVGIYNGAGTYGDSTTHNTGTITVQADGGTGFARAVGVAGLSENAAELVNDGVITVTTDVVDGPATAAGMYGVGSQLVSVRNYGDVDASATSANGDAYAYGALAFGGGAGIGLLINGGDLSADASAINGTAYAIGAFVTADVASLFNDGSASATATAVYGNAIAKAAWAYGSYTAVENTGTLLAQAQSTGGDATAHGADSIGYFGAATTNTGDIQVDATATGGHATAAGAYTLASIFSAYTTNDGAIRASATGASAISYGVLNAATYVGDAITINSGDIVASAEGGIAAYGETEAIAWGVYNFALAYGSYVVNSGAILAQATATADIFGTDGFLQAKAIGAAAMNGYGVWNTGIVNYGDIGAIAETSQGYASAWGVVARSGGAYGGGTFVDNQGAIHADARSDIGAAVSIGAYVASVAGDAAVTNAGDIVAYSRVEMGIPEQMLPDSAYATGVYVRSPYGATTLANTGTITGQVSGYGALVYAAGIQAFGDTVAIDNAEGATIAAIAELDRFGFAGATAIEAHGTYDVSITNAGDVVAYGSARGWEMPGYTFLGAAGAVGIYAEASFFGNVAVTNTGAITAIATASENIDSPSGAAGATGIHAYGKYDATVANFGDVFASATSDLGIAGSYGVMAKGKYTAHVVNGEGATIIALAQVGSQASDANAGRAIAFGTHTFGSDHATTTNDGAVIAHAIATAADGTNTYSTMASAWGLSIGAYSDGISGDIVNRGDVEAMASADFGYATAYGTNVEVSYVATTTNAGSILAMATADQGDAFAVGAQVRAIHFDVYYPCTPAGCDYSNPVFTPDGGDASLANTGTIVAAAYAEGGIARSYGVGMLGGFGATLTNAGDITAVTRADEAFATGAFVAAPYGSVTLDNAGTILAAAYGADATAIGVRMDSTGTNALANSGTIAAMGDGTRIAISSSIDAIAQIANAGTISGAIVTGNRADTFANALGATWRAVGTSDFGAGADLLTNHGLVFLDDALVRLGAAGEGDAFGNGGVVAIDGDSALQLGGVFRNDGIAQFLDGHADDTLALTGDFAGTGALRFDVDGVAQAGDWLRIDGNVDATAAQRIDVNFTGLPTSSNFVVPLVNVSGDAGAGNFALGDVWYQGGFLSLAFSLQADIDAGNATDDVFALAVDVTGFSGAGALAASVAPGAQSLIDAQVGTWRQRSGALPAQGASRLTPWVRVFADDGGRELGHDGFAAGDLGFDQANHGWELGIEARPTDHVSLGVLLASSEGDQRGHAGAGSDRFSGRAFGLFATWQGEHGLYVDASQRWTAIDAQLESAAGRLETTASASTTNLEAGFVAGAIGGFRLVPQLQVTRTRLGDIEPLILGDAVFVDDGGVSTRGRLGVAFDRTVQAGAVTLTPYGAINVVREFGGDYDHVVNGGLAGTSRTSGTGALVEFGLGARWKRWTFTGSVNRADGGSLEDVVGSQFTARYSW